MSALYTDFYELTMAQGYFFSGKQHVMATFDLFFRTNPFGGGYAVFAGLEDAINGVLNARFQREDIDYLRSRGLKNDFLSYLASFRFTGSIDAFREGDIVFPDDVLLRVTAPLPEAQIIESLLLNIINFQTLIATKATRTIHAAQGRPVMDFGMRRAQGFASIAASRASYIGGVMGTSNTHAAKLYDIPAVGTHAHSWVQGFESEYSAFKTFAELYPESTTLLVDTYDTVRTGIPNAIRVAKEMESSGKKLIAVRLDSGDFSYLSKKARAMLDEAGLGYVKIVASNQLDEYLIASLLEQHAPVDAFGVGTKLICAYDQPALDGVYKLSDLNGRATIKFSENPEKINNPGKKQVVRFVRAEDLFFLIDGILLSGERAADITTLRHPTIAFKTTSVSDIHVKSENIFFPIISNGELVYNFPPLREVRQFAHDRFSLLPDEHKRFTNPHVYRVGLSEQLYGLRQNLILRRGENA